VNYTPNPDSEPAFGTALIEYIYIYIAFSVLNTYINRLFSVHLQKVQLTLRIMNIANVSKLCKKGAFR